MRVALAAALFSEPDFLLLDEPTNYLDMEGALWLEARLQKYPYSAIIISHDRELLNNSVNFILHVREGKLDLYTGGYDDFERMRGEKARLAAATRVKIEAPARPHAVLRGPLPRQGVQGHPGPVAPEDAAEAAAHQHFHRGARGALHPTVAAPPRWPRR